MNTNGIEISVLVNNKPVKLFGHKNKTYIIANYGCEYEIKIRNNNHYRAMAVASVDGLDVLTGTPASRNNVGYVISAYDSISIKGFRKDNDTVGAFRFTKKKKAYAKEVTGSTENCGIIAVTVFAEKIYHDFYAFASPIIASSATWTTDYTYTTCQNNIPKGTSGRSNAEGILRSYKADCQAASLNDSVNFSSCSNSSASVSNQGLGLSPSSEVNDVPSFSAATTWGNKITDSVTTTTFEKASSNPLAEFSIYYDVKENLEKIGIDVKPKKQVSFPNAFPRDFAKPPSGWNVS